MSYGNMQLFLDKEQKVCEKENHEMSWKTLLVRLIDSLCCHLCWCYTINTTSCENSSQIKSKKKKTRRHMISKYN